VKEARAFALAFFLAQLVLAVHLHRRNLGLVVVLPAHHRSRPQGPIHDGAGHSQVVALGAHSIHSKHRLFLFLFVDDVVGFVSLP
jgi:hypothetical protein